MKMNRLYFLSLIIAIPVFVKAQENSFGVKFNGYVKNDFFYDSRQVVSIREGHFLLYPAAKSPDADKKDVNAVPNFNFLSIQSRLTGKITGPDAFGAKTSGVIEADFFGNENAAFVDANGFRLRHAFVKLSWEKTELLTGQYWHPLFQPGCFSGVISFNTGAPFQPFSRNTQMRLLRRFGKFSGFVALSAQRDFTSPQGTSALRNSGMPETTALFQYENKNSEKNKEFLAGIGGGYKVLKPLLFTDNNGKKYVTDETVSGYNATAFIKYKNSKITYKLQGVYGQNMFDMTMLGGYAVKEVIDTAKNTVTYTPTNTFSVWTEFLTNGAKIQFALWAGYTENLGSDNDIAYYSNKKDGTDITIRAGDIKSMYRVAPRVVFISGKYNFAVEGEYTSAAYATYDDKANINRNKKGKITGTEYISNLRLLLSVIYEF